MSVKPEGSTELSEKESGILTTVTDRKGDTTFVGFEVDQKTES
jgi:hypothetical protein